MCIIMLSLTSEWSGKKSMTDFKQQTAQAQSIKILHLISSRLEMIGKL
uniref:Uncharacterized protein n=1 Tax=Anguilla anguilla TaxID=7936 RepID=A0A0E9WSQ0_ANGAN